MPPALLHRMERAMLSGPALVLALGTALLFWIMLGPALLTADPAMRDGTGQVYGHDFAQFWTAGRMVLDGDAADLWDAEQFTAALRESFPGKIVRDGTRFHYPPPALLPFSAFALLPVTLAFPLMIFGGIALLLVALWRIVPGWRAAALVAGSPIILNAIIYGQWSLWLAGLLAFALAPMARDQTPRAGPASLFILKPTLGFALPLAFLFAPPGHRNVVEGLLWIALLIGLCVVVLGSEAWGAWYAALPDSRAALFDQLNAGLNQSVTLGSALQRLGVAPSDARPLQWGFTLIVLVCTAFLLHGSARGALKAAVLTHATVLAAPYCMVYDMALLVPAAFFFARDAQVHGFRLGDRSLLSLGAILPYGAAEIQASTGIPLAFIFMLTTFGWLAWRAYGSAAEEQGGSRRDGHTVSHTPGPGWRLQPKH